jgi:signal transduction histidine kinase
MGVRDRTVVQKLTPSGLLIAAIAFLLTRFTVTLAAGDDPVTFLLVGLGPLAVGLSVSIAGVALAVGAFPPTYVRTVALWTVLGTGSMGVLVALTLYGRPPAEMPMAAVSRETYLANFMIGGCVGGTLTGVYAARNERRRRAERAQAKRLAVLNHLVRDTALTAITAIRGRLATIRSGDEDARAAAVEVIEDRTATLADDVDEIRRLSRGAGAGATRLQRVDLVACLERSVAAVAEQFPEADLRLRAADGDAFVWATETVEDAFEMILEDAIERHPEAAPTVDLAVESAGGAHRVVIADDGPPLSAEQRSLLADESDDATVDPTGGFGLQVAALLVESYRGDLSATVTDAGTTITVELGAAEAGRTAATVDVEGLLSRGLTADRLALVAGCSLLAGLVMGLVADALTGAVPVIGALYGVADPLVGWVTHIFHSLVFGLFYAGLLAAARARLDRGHAGRIAVALVWASALWFFAAGIVMPIWLGLVGVTAPVPMLAPSALLTHLLWGAFLGTTYSLGREWLDARAEREAVPADAGTPP